MTVLIPPPHSPSLHGEKKRKDGMKDGQRMKVEGGRERKGRVHSDHPRTTL